jgi:hypothetical protein
MYLTQIRVSVCGRPLLVLKAKERKKARKSKGEILRKRTQFLLAFSILAAVAAGPMLRQTALVER